MRKLEIGDVTITSIIERDGPWRRPEDMFPAYDPEIGRRHLAELDPFVFDVASGRMVITYQTFVVRTPIDRYRDQTTKRLIRTQLSPIVRLFRAL